MGRCTSTGPNQFIIQASGGVGIGTSDPVAALDVRGDLSVDGYVSIGYPPDFPLSVSTSSEATAIFALNTGTSEIIKTGVQGASTGKGNSNYGIFGTADGAILNMGVYGRTSSTDGRGVYGQAIGSGKKYGVYGLCSSPSGYAGYFEGRAYFSDNVGIGTNDPVAALDVRGNVVLTNSADKTRVEMGIPAADVGLIATYGPNDQPNVVISALFGTPNHGFIGVQDAAGIDKVQIFVDSSGNGTVNADIASAGVKSFKIDHPVDPANKFLYHSVIESPDMMNVYNGNVVTDADGLAWVELPGYFEALNRDFRYQLTVVGQFAQAIVDSKVRNNRFSIRSDKPDVEVSWQVTGIRQDPFANAHRVKNEVLKLAHERGRYLHPEVYDQAPKMRIPTLAVEPAAAGVESGEDGGVR